MQATKDSPVQHIWQTGRSYKQEELNDLAMDVIRYVQDYYPDKIAIVGMRTYFRRSHLDPRMEMISKIIYRIQRVRERYVTTDGFPHQTIKVEAAWSRDGAVNIRIID